VISLSTMKTQIVFAGVGGQGILFASRIFSELGLKLGLNVMASETHGMSQRGGSVVAHLKLGDFYGPIIREGTADILYSFEEIETYRVLKFLKRGGRCFANLEDVGRFDQKILDHLQSKEILFRAFDASGEAFKIGSVKSANILLIGYSVGTGLVAFKSDDICSVLEMVSQKENLEMNLKAFEAGVRQGRSERK
jgi:indolepyruvate ferredoxin oxidoreductase beta subunit